MGSFVWKHFTVTSDPEDPNSGKQCHCCHCGKTFVVMHGNTSNMREHLLKHHNDEVDPEDKMEKHNVKNIKKAPGEPRTNKSFVWKHFTISSDPEDPNSAKQCLCRHCGKTLVMYGNATNMREHLLKQHNDEVDPEDKVAKGNVGSFVWNHFTKDNATGNCDCQHCGMSIINTCGGTTKLRDHIKKFHPEKFDPSTPYVRPGAEDQGEPQYIMDPESGEMMTEKEYKKKHKKIRKNTGKEMKKTSVVWNFFHKDPEDKTKTICQICFKVLLYSGSNGTMFAHLRHHKVLQEDDVEIPCPECGKLLKNKAALKRHEKTQHLDTDRFVCSYCPKAFCSNHKRLIHERIHTGEKPYQCQECGSNFRQRQQLTSHMRVHTGEMPYSCPKCLQRFKHSAGRNSHKCGLDLTI